MKDHSLSKRKLVKPLIVALGTFTALSLSACNPSQTSSATPSSSPAESSATSSSSPEVSSSQPSSSQAPKADETDVTAGRNKFATLGDKGKFYTDYSSLADEQKAAKEVAVQIAEEGDTLLKNANGALPLAKSEKHVTCFGMHSVNLVTAGGGSGAGSTGNNGITPSTLQSSLEDAGFVVNPSTLNLYNAYTATGTINNELPIADYTPSAISSYYGYADAAIITFSRQGTENKDLLTNRVTDHANADDHILQLDDNEVALVKHVKQHFSKVIVLINSSNIMQIPDLSADKTAENLGVDAILWIGGVGNNGVDAVGQILNGNVCPSGHTADIWPSDFSKDPTWTNFGFDTQNKDADGNRMDSSYYDKNGKITNYNQVEYREGIYQGYKYYETVAADKGAEGASWYKTNVVYPFGYGLSYTSFNWEWSDTVDGANIEKANQTVTTKVKVTNTGTVAGKDVVQIYYSAPYTKGGIEKASNNLVNFAKTKVLQPGESQILTIQFVAQDMASFDYNDANKNEFKGYELEKGKYTITANRNSHEPVLSLSRNIVSDILCKTDYTTGKEIKPIFTGEFDSTNATLLANLISRSAGLKQPAASTKADRTLTDAVLAEYDDQDIYNHYEDDSSDPWYAASVPSTWTQGATTAGLKLADMANIDYEDLLAATGTDEGSKKWETFMNELSWEDLCNIVSGDNGGAPNIGEIAAIGHAKESSYADGPVQIRGGTLFPSAPIMSATYNVELVEKMGRLVGNEGIFLDHTQWAGPAMDTHRSPFSGRNFEYYSQDGFHAAKFAAAAVKGAMSKGLICYAKHFFLNDQESFRADFGGVFTWATEQTIREDYLRPFEAVAKAGNMGFMSSFNRIGKQVTAESYAVHQYLLRDEWDSKADVVTDAWAKAYVPLNKMAVAGSDQLLGTSSSYAANALDHGTWDASKNGVLVKGSESSTSDDTLSPTLYAGMRRRAQRALFARANSTAAKNGVTSGQTIDVYVERDVSNNVAIQVAGTNDINVSLATGATMPAGLSITNGMVVSGTPTAEGTTDVKVNLTVDGWVTSTAVLRVHVVSAMHLDGKAVSTGATSATIKTGEAYEAKVDTPALAYGAMVAGPKTAWGQMNALIVNYYTYHGTVYNRNEDKTASDIITIDAATADSKTEYGYAISAGTLPDGLTAEPVMKSHAGLANRGSYDVVDYYKISGTPTTAGTYTFSVTLSAPTVTYMSGWLFASFGASVKTYTQAFTLVVE